MKHFLHQFLFTVLLFSLPQIVSAQAFSIYGDAGFNIGLQSGGTMDFGGNTMGYGYGSGVGIHVGLQYDSELPVFLYTEFGLNASLAFQYESFNGASNKSAFNFNYKHVSFGVGRIFLFKNSTFIHGVKLNTGLDFNFPASASQTENNQYYGEINYSNSIGYHLEARLIFKYREVFFIEPGLSYNNASFSYTDYQWQSNMGNAPADFMLSPLANHISLSVHVRKVLRSREQE
jgi:hypothetical protein